MKKVLWKRAAAGMVAAVMTAGILGGCSAVGTAPTIASEEGTEAQTSQGGSTEAAKTEAGKAGTENAEAKDAESKGTEAGEKKNRLEQIQERGYLEVATEPYFAPNEFIDPSKQGQEQYVGSDMELAKLIADELGVELRIVPLEFSAVQTGVTEGKYDMAISALAYTPARAEAMELSNGYRFTDSSVQYGMMIRQEDLETIKTPEDLADRVVVCQSGSLQEMFAQEQIPACRELKRVSATTDGFLMVQEGKADAVVTEKTTAQLYIDANSGCDMVIVPDFSFLVDESTQGTRIGMPKGETELRDRVNEILAEVVESGIYDQWYQEYQDYARSLGL